MDGMYASASAANLHHWAENANRSAHQVPRRATGQLRHNVPDQIHACGRKERAESLKHKEHAQVDTGCGRALPHCVSHQVVQQVIGMQECIGIGIRSFNGPSETDTVPVKFPGRQQQVDPEADEGDQRALASLE